ncbi:MAG TPA: bifunctional metallophosphatase/5'-nucleotidase [Sphingomicrobium sp.]|nr:bifunctional metallophosphatase/5'-nucleotidase [Sphingomicrobium sp.]
MIRKFAAALAALCLTIPAEAAPRAVEVQILAINDFHGNLETPPERVKIARGDGTTLDARVGGAAQLAAALKRARLGHPATITVAAGDLIGASPLTSAYFLDEPTIDAMNLLGLSVASVGNHEFDKGSRELLRMQRGGCAKYTARVACRLEPFKGARFEYLAANVLKADGSSLFPATAVRQVGPVKIGFIGMTLKDTGNIVTPTGVAGLHFADEAATANALVPRLKAAGANAIVLLIHQGGKVPETYVEQGCTGLTGDILPILDRLDPSIVTILSGHTHNAYACALDRGSAHRLLTSAGKYGYLYTDLRLSFDASTHRLLSETAVNVPVTGTAGADAKVAALVQRYAQAVAPAAARVVGHLAAPLMTSETERESPVADLIADAQFAASKAAKYGGADLSFINSGGVRTNLVPRADASVTYAQIFALEPFGNTLVVKTLTGGQLQSLLEQQFRTAAGVPQLVPSILIPSANFRFAYDLTRPTGQRIVSMTLNGKPIDPNGRYRVTVNNFLASGGDGYSLLAQGTQPADAGLDLDALEAWLATNPARPAGGRISDATPR